MSSPRKQETGTPARASGVVQGVTSAWLYSVLQHVIASTQTRTEGPYFHRIRVRSQVEKEVFDIEEKKKKQLVIRNRRKQMKKAAPIWGGRAMEDSLNPASSAQTFTGLGFLHEQYGSSQGCCMALRQLKFIEAKKTRKLLAMLRRSVAYSQRTKDFRIRTEC